MDLPLPARYQDVQWTIGESILEIVGVYNQPKKDIRLLVEET